VEKNVGTSATPIATGTTERVLVNSTLANFGLRVTITDVNAGNNLSFTTTVTPQANIPGFVQAEWNGGPSTTQPVIAQPTSGTLPTLGPITVSIAASDGVGGTASFNFTMLIVPPPLAGGTYTIANGNPGSAFDYGDLGVVFDYLEAAGMSGPVTLQLYDDGGPFTSTTSYALGCSNTIGDVTIPILGLGAANPLVIQAAPGETPVISGGTGALLSFNVADVQLGLMGVTHVTVEGLTITNGTDAGIGVYGGGNGAATNLNIVRNRIFNITNGPGIALYMDSGLTLVNVLVENNFIYGCTGSGAAWTANQWMQGGIALRRADPTTVIRHNTVVMNNAAAGRPCIGYTGGGGGTGFVIEYNVLVAATNACPVLDLALDPVSSNYNIMYQTNGATFDGAMGVAYADFAAWQTANFDLNGSAANPMLASIALGTEDLHLQPGSPAIDTATLSMSLIDFDGHPRPQGAASDIGADEALPPAEIEVFLGATNITDGGTVNAGVVSSVAGGQFTFSIFNLGPGDLLLTGTPLVDLVPGTNCGAGTLVQMQPAASTIPATAVADFVVFVDPLAAGAFDLTISIANTDANENPFNFTLMGNANAAAEVMLAAGSSFGGAPGGPFTLTVTTFCPIGEGELRVLVVLGCIFQNPV
jgi:hypothetical protein